MNDSDALESVDKGRAGPFHLNLPNSSGETPGKSAFLPPFMEKSNSATGGGGSGSNNLTMNHSFRSRTSTIHNPSQVSVI